MCAICGTRPTRTGAYCHNCNSKLAAGKCKRKAEKPVKYATYRGHVVGFFRNGGDKLAVRLLGRKPEGLPKNMTLDLNTYIQGMTRVQVKKIKSAILTLARV